MVDAAVLDPPAPPAAPSPTDWRTHLTDELKADPVVAGWAEKAGEKDIAALIRTNAHAQHRMGNAINLPGKDAKPEEVSALKEKLIQAGLMPAPIKDPKDYAIAKPANLPAGVQWSDDLTSKLATTLHKYQVPKEAVADLLALHMESLGGAVGAVQIDRDAAMAQLKAEHGEKYDERVEMVSRMMPGIFSQETLDLFDQTGIGNDPKFISALLRLAPLAMQDSSFIETLPVKGGEISGEAATAEYADIMSNPKNPRYEGFHRGDKAVLQYIDDLYKRAHGTGVQKIGEGVSAG